MRRATFGLDEWGPITRTIGVAIHLFPGAARLPHTYRKEDFCTLLTAARRALAVIPLKSLQVQYPRAMYTPEAGGMARFQAGVRPPPPPPWVWHLADLPAVSALRAVVGENVPAHRLLGPV